MSIIVEVANIDDVSAIVKINNQNLITNKKSFTDAQLAESGFLIMPYTEESVNAYVGQDKYLALSAKINNEVVGYAISYNLIYEEELNSHISNITPWNKLLATSKVLYLSQIAKKPEAKGVGKQLMSAILDYSVSHDYHYIISQVIHKPICNEGSIMFHKHFGFDVITEIIRNDGNNAGVYLKKL
jgi:predicted GNAT superfamily acetyltransferase